MIDNMMISFYLSNNDKGSKFTFGGYLENLVKQNHSIIWNSINSGENGKKFWEVNVTDLIYGTSIFTRNSFRAIVDSGT